MCCDEILDFKIGVLTLSSVHISDVCSLKTLATAAMAIPALASLSDTTHLEKKLFVVPPKVAKESISNVAVVVVLRQH
jgi:hypothetical protein